MQIFLTLDSSLLLGIVTGGTCAVDAHSFLNT